MSAKPYKYKEEYCKKLIEHMAKGLSLEAFAGSINVTRDCIYKWKKVNPEFGEAFEIGKARQHMFFETMGIKAMNGGIKNFQASTYIFTLKNKLKWKDTVEQEISGKGITVNYSRVPKEDDE